MRCVFLFFCFSFRVKHSVRGFLFSFDQILIPMVDHLFVQEEYIDDSMNYTLNTTLGGCSIAVFVDISWTFKTRCQFDYLNERYTFVLKAWASNGTKALVRFFHDAANRDAGQYGTLDRTKDLKKQELVLCADVLQQKRNIVQTAVEDIFLCLDKLYQKHRKHLLEYAVWYRDHYLNPDLTNGYNEYITKLTCHSVVHSAFLASDTKFEFVEFDLINDHPPMAPAASSSSPAASSSSPAASPSSPAASTSSPATSTPGPTQQK